MASNSQEVVEERQVSSNRGKQKKCASCGGFNANASKHCKGCGAEIKIKTFDWMKLKNKKKTHPTQQRKILEYRANVLNMQHGWHVVILCLAKHKRGRSLYTYGTPGVGLQFVGSKKEKASKAGRLCVSLFKKFAKQNGCKSDEEVNDEEVRNEGDDANTTTEAATSGAEDSVTGNSNMDLEVMEVEYNADVDLDPAIDDVGLNDVYGRVGLGGVFQDDLSVGGAAHGGSEGAVADVPHTGIAGAETDGGIAGREEVAGVQEGPPSLVAGEGIASTVSGDGVAYVVDSQIKAVGNVDHTRKVLHGHQISSGYVCVKVSYVQSQTILAPLVLGDKEENCFLKKGMFFAFPVSKLFKLEKLVAGDKVVLQKYVP